MFSGEPTNAKIFRPVKLQISGKLLLFKMPMSVFGKKSSGRLVTGLKVGNRFVVKKISIHKSK